MNINRLLISYLAKIAHSEPPKEKTIDEIMEKQDRPTIPTDLSNDERELYEKLLKSLREEIVEDKLTENEEKVLKDAGDIFPAPFKNPPHWAASEKIWDEAKAAVKKHWNHYDTPWSVVADLYFKMGGKRKK